MLLLWCLSPGNFSLILEKMINSEYINLDGSERELGFLLKRLVAVTNGDEAKEVFVDYIRIMTPRFTGHFTKVEAFRILFWFQHARRRNCDGS